ncbi:hypothetical protein [Clostridium estertheticum]|uniref:hypothetical protein n=1 Tax=Clostridium estertheticum TaxID=238834 RepID=UPI001C0E29DD|nr:hypothetical protein [Clostridium estertheticum]MBU3186619.1 hypothetical protein [Clostridium estertheticum]
MNIKNEILNNMISKAIINNKLNDNKALIFAEKYGVIEYKVINSKMIFYTNYPQEHSTYKCTVNLKSMLETRKALKRYYHIGNYNMCI